MGRKSSTAALFVVLAATLLQSTYAAVNYTVGDSTGWRVPDNRDFYDNWADNKNFAVGDILVFSFTTGAHDVASVTEAEYDACSATNNNAILRNGSASITLNRTGDHYFICTFPGHCSGGQKLKVEVNGTSTNAPTPGSTPSPPGTLTPPPPSSATSLVATISLVFMSIALFFFC